MITTGPPHSSHLVGLKIKKKFDINWIVDFRDPWSEIFYTKNQFKFKISKKLIKVLKKKLLILLIKLLLQLEKNIMKFYRIKLLKRKIFMEFIMVMTK